MAEYPKNTLSISQRLCLVALAIVSLNIHSAAILADEPTTPSKAAKFVVSPEALKIHQSTYVWDGHNDLPWAIRESGSRSFEKLDIAEPQPQLHTDIDRLKKGNVGAQFWSVYVPADTAANGTAYQMTLEQIELVHAMIAKYPSVFEQAKNAEDVIRIRAAGKIASLIGVEGGHSIENSIEKLRRLSSLGANYMTLTHSDTLDWADAATDEAKNGGLSAFGEEVIREMNRLGMLVDLSHVSPETMRDALSITKAPVIFSHSSAKAVADHPRNVPDDILKLLPANGGIVMVNFFSGFVVPESALVMADMFNIRRELKAKFPDDKEAYEREYRRWQAAHPMVPGDASIVADHIHHIIQVAGIDHVGIGSDYDGIGMLPEGLADVSTYPVLTQLLLDRGYTAVDISKIMSGNMLRVLQQSDAVSKELAGQ